MLRRSELEKDPDLPLKINEYFSQNYRELV